MKAYAAWHDEWNDYHNNFAWQTLSEAVGQCGLEFDGEAHGALADAKATLAVLDYMVTTGVNYA